MSYKGIIVTIPLGQGGIFTDEPHTKIPVTKLIRAVNVALDNGVAEKDFGSQQWNETVLDGGVLAFSEWFPEPHLQRVIAFCDNGKVYRFTNQMVAATEVTASGGAPATLGTGGFRSFVRGGNEVVGNNKKLFLFTGESPVQVISGDGTTRTSITSPPADWTGTNQPIGAVNFRNRIFAFGNSNNPHGVYASSATNHEDFTSTPLTFSVWPGDGDGIVGGFIFRKKLFVVKYPVGLYVLVDDDTDTDNWFFAKVNDDFGGVSPSPGAPAGDDYWIANAEGSITSLIASERFGDVESANIFNLLKAKQFFSQEISGLSTPDRCAYHYKAKQKLFFNFRSIAGTEADRMVVVSLRNKDAPELTLSTKDQANCLSGIRDVNGIERPCYGSSDGYIYEMDRPNRWVGGDSDPGSQGDGVYTFEIITPHLDFDDLQPGVMGELQKTFEFLELTYEPTGDWDCNIDVFMDGRFHKTIPIRLDGPDPLDSLQLSESRLADRLPLTKQVKLDGQARRIQFRCYNEESGQNVRLVKLRVFFRPIGHDQAKPQN